MNLLVLSTSTNNTHTFIGSLESLGQHRIKVIRYDSKMHEEIQELLKNRPDIREAVEKGAQIQLPPERCRMDAELIREAKTAQPDAIIYISAYQGNFVPTDETLHELNTIAPLVHFCSDAADPPWWPVMQRHEESKVFSLVVTIDGAHYWPGSDNWKDYWRVTNGLTLLTPIDTRVFSQVQTNPPFRERPYGFGYAGNQYNHARSMMVQQIQKAGGAFRPRDDNPGSYPQYIDFIRFCRVVVSVPYTGSNAAKHIKGRVVEVAYAGACLLEWAQPAMRDWFQPRLHYWEYETIEEGIEIAQFLAGHPKIAEETAQAFTEIVKREHSPDVFWGKVLEHIGK
jgi:hypothetical protein